ncbi:MAG: hypothetical protein RMK34_03020 [Tepidimonas sp.]|uniref:hypothetical protein n=1 Tax=Tepidimonas sp. TaxID=2002775 RepID=UPI00298F147A|nr:hypothetical protein [Tepidimonas sp.]MCS6810806.1 hypothetical protein [Tepidimonas sp.]MDW8335921.1 hypothetical protein [Tepidimonas sp.]
MPDARRPPVLVPTLTDVVAPGRVPSAGVDEALVDALVDRVMLRVQPLLQQRLQAAWMEWLGQQLSRQGPELTASLVNDIADVVRAEIAAALDTNRD